MIKSNTIVKISNNCDKINIVFILYNYSWDAFMINNVIKIIINNQYMTVLKSIRLYQVFIQQSLIYKLSIKH